MARELATRVRRGPLTPATFLIWFLPVLVVVRQAVTLPGYGTGIVVPVVIAGASVFDLAIAVSGYVILRNLAQRDLSRCRAMAVATAAYVIVFGLVGIAFGVAATLITG